MTTPSGANARCGWAVWVPSTAPREAQMRAPMAWLRPVQRASTLHVVCDIGENGYEVAVAVAVVVVL